MKMLGFHPNKMILHSMDNFACQFPSRVNYSLWFGSITNWFCKLFSLHSSDLNEIVKREHAPHMQETLSFDVTLMISFWSKSQGITCNLL